MIDSQLDFSTAESVAMEIYVEGSCCCRATRKRYQEMTIFREILRESDAFEEEACDSFGGV
jgi:hypothetical protein